MKIQKTIALALSLAALGPAVASASTLLDTGTPTGSSSVLLNTSDWYAAEFSATAGETVTELEAYLTQGVGAVGDTFTWDIYSASGTFLGANREGNIFTTTGTFAGNGWNSTSIDWTPTTSGLYWVALQVSSTTQTRGLDLPTETSTTTGTVPATEFAFAGTNGRYAETSTGVGLEVSTVPVPAAIWLLGSGLMGLGVLGRRRGSNPAV
jgi:hypothetical protein